MGPATVAGIERPAATAGGQRKVTVGWAHRAPRREPLMAIGRAAGEQPVLPLDQFLFDDLPMHSEEDLAGVRPMMMLPEPLPHAGDAQPATEVALLPQMPPERPPRGRPQWLANAVDPVIAGRGPLVAIVIDDVGIDQDGTARAVELPAPVTLAFIPYGYNLDQHTRKARRGGHELLVHMPMEPSSGAADPGPNALLTSLPQDEIMRRFRWGLSRFEGYVGVSNHMGSRFMARADLVKPLLGEVERRGLLFLDSWTRADTAGTGLARDMGIPNTRRDVFLDNEQTEEEVAKRLAHLENLARRKGYAIGLGHPHDVTLDVLERWIPEARARGITLVPVSTIVRLEYGEGFEGLLVAATGGGEADRLLGGAD